MKRAGVLLLAIAIASLTLGCPKKKPPPPSGNVTWRVSKSGEGFRLSDADEGETQKSIPLANAKVLSEADTKAVLARLPALPALPADAEDFKLRDKSKPAPRPGKTITDAFPPPNNPPPPTGVAGGALTVTRKSPVGAVELAPFLSVSFSQPLVAITSDAELTKIAPPVKLSPQPPGEWRWLGTQTVIFQPTKRFPMSTDYEVEVPAGTKPLVGEPLAAPEKWTFSTPTLKLKTSAPNSYQPVDLEPILFAEFDQNIDPKAVLAATKLNGSVPLRLATEAEIDASKTVRALSSKAEPNRWMAFRAEGKLDAATSYSVQIGPGAPSLEGPKKTDNPQTFSFRTYGAMKIDAVRCSYGGPCPPMSAITIQASNPIDTKKFVKSMVHVSPDLPAMKVTAAGQNVTVWGRTKGRTKYHVKIDGSLPDTFGQTLGKSHEADVEIGPAEPRLWSENADMSVLDPGGPAKLPIFSVNEPTLHVRLYAVEPSDWAAYRTFRRDWDAEAKIATPPGRLVQDTYIQTKGAPDELTETLVDLNAALKDGLGQVIAIVEPNRPPPPPSERWRRQWFRSWLQVTKLGLDAFVDNEELVGWTTDLKTGEAVRDVEVSLLGAGSAKSGGDGLAHLALSDQPGSLLFGRKGSDVVILPEGSFSYGWRGRAYFGESSFRRNTIADQPVWLVFDDRRMYRPGEEPHVKGWLRRQGMQRGGDVGMTPDTGKSIAWTVRDSRGAEVAKGENVAIDSAGGFDFSFKVPTTANLGPATVQLNVQNSALASSTYTHSLSFEEFRRPEFEVNAQSSTGPHIVGGHAVTTVSATYYAGGGLPNADVQWTATSAPGSFSPPNRSEYTFGVESGLGWYRGHSVRGASEGNGTATWTSKTGPNGAHRLRVDFDALERPRPLSINLTASVTDVNRQSWTARTSLLVHPADVYVGLKRARGFVKAGDSISVDAIVSDLEGKLVGDKKIELRAARLDWEQEGDEYVEKEKDPSSCEVESKADPVSCKLKTKEGGTYRISAIVHDAEGRKSLTEMRVWVVGEKMPIDREIQQDLVQVVTDKTEYRAGDTAEVLVISPFAPAEGVLVVQRQGMVKVQRFSMKAQAQTLTMKIEDAWTPGAGLSVHLVGADLRTNSQGEPDANLPKRPAFAVGTGRLNVPPKERALTITVSPREKAIEPGGSTTVDVDAKNVKGEAAPRTELALVVVDEAVLALSGYKLPDPLSVFYTHRSDGTRAFVTRPHVLLAKPEDALAMAPGGDLHGGGGGGALALGAAPLTAPAASATAAPRSEAAKPMEAPADEAESIMDTVSAKVVSKDKAANNRAMTVRKDFAALALFAQKITTDDRGHASIPVKVPDSLTRYRVMVVAVQGENRFGSGEATLTARLPLMVRASPPRFLNYGDSFEMPIVVQNQTDKPMDVDVAMRATNAKVEATGRRVTVPANDRVEVRIPGSTVKAGTARFQIGGASGRFSDANQHELVVWTPATTEAFATYGTIDDGAIARPVKMPEGVAPQFGGLEITTSSTALQALTDAVLYLVHYPYECNEQLSSRIVSIAALRDVLGAFQTKDMPAPEALIESMTKDITRLKSRQLGDGSWAFWPGRPGNPFVTVHVTHALVRAKDKGFEVDGSMLERAKNYLRNIEAHIDPSWSIETRRALIAYALNVRAKMGEPDRPRAKRLITEAGGVEKLSLETDGWLLGVLTGDAGSSVQLGQLRRHFANRVTETSGAAHFVTSYGDAGYLILDSDRRADGVILESLILDQPKSDLIPKLVTGLLAHKKAGHWGNTQENAFVLLALDKYFNTYEKTTPDFVARAWLGDRYAGEHAFKGRTTERHEVKVAMMDLADYAKNGADLTIEKQGAGRLYYRIGMQYAPSDLRPPPIDRGFVVTRLYEGVDKPEDVRRDPDGTWHVKSGAKVRVRVGMVAQARRYHVALVDPLPAGFEVVNPALAVSGDVPQDPSARTSPTWWWRGTWYEHQNMRDERVEAFTTLLSEGVYDYTYVARATTPGTFIVAPPKAEEMYSPETFGRGAGDRMIIE